MRRGPPLSATATRAPKLKSKRNPSGPSWVGNSAGGGKCGFGGGSAEVAAAPDAEAAPGAEPVDAGSGAPGAEAAAAEAAGAGAAIVAEAGAIKEEAGAIKEKGGFCGSGRRLGRSLSGGLDKGAPMSVGEDRPASEPAVVDEAPSAYAVAS